ncbi:hypothetical protein SUGI_0916070 [Cryptomeria japonica]|nr:hypothetical protein SUGI_0916070 [Cryptomeria japonica]
MDSLDKIQDDECCASEELVCCIKRNLEEEIILTTCSIFPEGSSGKDSVTFDMTSCSGNEEGGFDLCHLPGKPREISILLKGDILEKQVFCFGILCISFLWSVIFNGHGGRQQQEFYVLEWLIGVMDRKCQDIWNFQQFAGINAASPYVEQKTFGIFNNLLE